MTELAKRLKALRERKNFTITQVAENIGVAISTYREWENGRAIKGEPYVKLADLFGVSIYYLMTGQDGEFSEVMIKLDKVKNSLYHLERELREQL